MLCCLLQEEEIRENRLSFATSGVTACNAGGKDGAIPKAANNTAQPAAAVANAPPLSAVKSHEEMRKLFIDRAKKIDTISRAGFPLAFLCFNIFYWVLYKILWHEDVHQQ